MKQYLAIFTAILPLGCFAYYLFDKNAQLASREQLIAEQVNKLPTAMEIFNLRSKCAALGKKMSEDKGGEDISHYDPKINRCYVQLSNSMDTNLYDGQTGELLAVAVIKSIYNGKRDEWGMIYDDQYKAPLSVPYNGEKEYDTAKAYIDERMADDRKQ